MRHGRWVKLRGMTGDEEGRLGNLGDDATAMRREEEGMGDEGAWGCGQDDEGDRRGPAWWGWSRWWGKIERKWRWGPIDESGQCRPWRWGDMTMRSYERWAMKRKKKREWQWGERRGATREDGDENLRVGDDGDEATLLPCHLLHSSLMVLYTFGIVLLYFYRSISV